MEQPKSYVRGLSMPIASILAERRAYFKRQGTGLQETRDSPPVSIFADAEDKVTGNALLLWQAAEEKLFDNSPREVYNQAVLRWDTGTPHAPPNVLYSTRIRPTREGGTLWIHLRLICTTRISVPVPGEKR